MLNHPRRQPRQLHRFHRSGPHRQPGLRANVQEVPSRNGRQEHHHRDGRRQLDLAVDGAIWGGFGTTGQRCTAASRVAVHKKVYGEFVEKFVARAKALKVGDGLNPATEMGPCINEQQLQTVMKYVEIGKNEGAKLAAGGHRLESGGYAQRLVPRADRFRRLRSEDAHLPGRNFRPGRLRDSVRHVRRRDRNRQRREVRPVRLDLHAQRERRIPRAARSAKPASST